jgi:hypothetical protein
LCTAASIGIMFQSRTYSRRRGKEPICDPIHPAF